MERQGPVRIHPWEEDESSDRGLGAKSDQQLLGGSENPPQKRKRKALLYPMLPWGLPAAGIMRTQGAVFLQAWDIVIAFAVLYVAFMVPYSLGFQRLYLRPADGDSSEQCLFSQSTELPFTVTRWIDLLVDLLFVSDILINFVSARWVLQVRVSRSDLAASRMRNIL